MLIVGVEIDISLKNTAMLLTDLQTESYFNGFDYGTQPDFAPTITAYDEDDDLEDEDDDIDEEDDDLDEVDDDDDVAVADEADTEEADFDDADVVTEDVDDLDEDDLDDEEDDDLI